MPGVRAENGIMKGDRSMTFNRDCGLTGKLRLLILLFFLVWAGEAACDEEPALETVNLPLQAAEPGDANFILALRLPPGYKLNQEAPSSVTVSCDRMEVLSFVDGGKHTFLRPHFPIEMALALREGRAAIRVDLVLYLCEEEEESLCLYQEVRLNLPVEVRKGAGKREIPLRYELKEP